jgi:hypothetical protein
MVQAIYRVLNNVRERKRLQRKKNNGGCWVVSDEVAVQVGMVIMYESRGFKKLKMVRASTLATAEWSLYQPDIMLVIYRTPERECVKSAQSIVNIVEILPPGRS